MRNFLILLLFLSFQFITAQEQPQRISISFEETPLSEVLMEIEKRSNYRFYFVEEWLTGKNVSGSYENTPLKVILEELLKNTFLNYYIYNKKIILTQNNIVYDTLPEGFFAIPEETVVETEEVENRNVNPVFLKEEDAGLNTIETIRIGPFSEIELENSPHDIGHYLKGFGQDLE